MPDLDLLLINPGGSRKKTYQSLEKSFAAVEPPFWAALTGGFIRNTGRSVDLLDANAENLNFLEVAEEIEKRNPTLTNIVVYGQHPSASTQLMTSVELLCNQIKEKNPERKILLTGLHPSSLPRRTLEESRCDFVAEGEGFHTINELLNKAKLENVPGLWYKQDGKINSNPRARNIQDLTSELGNVAWDLIPFDKGIYRAHNWQCLDDFTKRPNYASLSTSLGCPFKCDFCSIHTTFGERRIRYWNPKWAVDQIEKLVKDKDIKIFKIIDELFVLSPDHYLGISNEIIKRGLGDQINIWAYARVDTTKEQHLETLRRAGFQWLCFGFESGNAEILKDVHKGNYTPEDMIKIRDGMKNADINVIGNYMFGFPEDTEETMKQTLDLAIEQNCEFSNFYSAMAWPGSLLYDQTLKKNIRMPEKWEDYAQHAYGFVPLPTKTLSPEEVLSFRDKSFYTYFSNSRYLDMIEKKFGLNAKKHIQEMTKFEIKRKILEK